jgi:hypothetical protein
MFNIDPIYLSVKTKSKPSQMKLFRIPLVIVRALEKAAYEADMTQTGYLVQLLKTHFRLK